MDDLLLSELPTGCTIQPYAYDICITISSKDANFLDHTAKRVITLVEKWSDENKLNFDVNKCEAIIFTKKREIPEINLRFLSRRIPISDKVRCLGLIFDRKLLWNDHVESKIKVGKQYSTKLLCGARSIWGLKPFALR